MVVGGLNFIIEEEDDANTQIKFFFFVLLFYLLVLLVVLLVQPILFFAYLYTSIYRFSYFYQIGFTSLLLSYLTDFTIT